MGQLIKLQDYVSRYEQSIYNYPARFVQLKKQQWTKLHARWEEGLIGTEVEQFNQNIQDLYELDFERESVLQRVKGFLKFNKKVDQLDFDEQWNLDNQDEDDNFEPEFNNSPDTLESLKQQFLDQLFRFQMKWASSTLTAQSIIDDRFYVDQRLKYFLQRFPDNLLVLYRPIFLLKKAPVEVEVILITPTEVQCIAIIEKQDEAVFVGSNNNFWDVKVGDREERILNPILSVNRMDSIVSDIFKVHDVDLPVRKIILSRNGYIDYPTPPFDLEFVELRNYEAWFSRLRTMSSPLKHSQLKAAHSLLQYCQTRSVRRFAWENSDFKIEDK